LRAAVMQGNFISEGALIFLPAGTFTLTRPPSVSNGAESGDLNIEKDFAVFGAGAESSIIDGNCLDRVFKVEAGRHLSLYSLTVRNGCTGQHGGGILVLGIGFLDHVTVRDNQADKGGGVAAEGSQFSMNESSILDNLAAGSGGGLYDPGSGWIDIVSSTFSGNSAFGDGAGMYLTGPADLHLNESTISSNSANSSGGGIYVGGQAMLNVYSSTIAFNRADANDNGFGDGGGIVNEVGASGTVNVRNCLIVGNYLVNFFDWDDCVGAIGSYGHNLFWDVAGCSIGGPGGSDLLNDLNTIGPLAKHGGATRTHALLAGSSAIDGADPVNGCLHSKGPFTVDQRGVPRVNGVRCDVGSYEAGILFADGFETGDRSAWPSASP
jgi:predicted outer membrane repeat protein